MPTVPHLHSGQGCSVAEKGGLIFKWSSSQRGKEDRKEDEKPKMFL